MLRDTKFFLFRPNHFLLKHIFNSTLKCKSRADPLQFCGNSVMFNIVSTLPCPWQGPAYKLSRTPTLEVLFSVETKGVLQKLRLRVNYPPFSDSPQGYWRAILINCSFNFHDVLFVFITASVAKSMWQAFIVQGPVPKECLCQGQSKTKGSQNNRMRNCF